MDFKDYQGQILGILKNNSQGILNIFQRFFRNILRDSLNKICGFFKNYFSRILKTLMKKLGFFKDVHIRLQTLLFFYFLFAGTEIQSGVHKGFHRCFRTHSNPLKFLWYLRMFKKYFSSFFTKKKKLYKKYVSIDFLIPVLGVTHLKILHKLRMYLFEIPFSIKH